MTDSKKIIYECINSIKELDYSAMQKAREYQSTLAMPPGSLGLLQDIGGQIAGITGRIKNTVGVKRIIVLCADNGVVSEGVSSAPKSVTASQAVNMTRYLTGMSCLAKHFGNQVQVVDVGIETEYECPSVLNKNIRHGTDNIVLGPAMTKNESERAIAVGIELAGLAKKDGVELLGVGEMGIGNTTTSTAVLSALTGVSPLKITGRGGGLTDEAFEKKIKVIECALSVNKPDSNDVIDVLHKVGGLDIAAMCGVFLGAAQNRIPVVIDGYISIVAALCAYRMSSMCAGYFIPSHQSEECGYMIAAKELNLMPFLNLKMRLGEGSGCPLAFQIVEAACTVMNSMASFEQASIDDSYLEEIRRQ
ncbi:MAG: nicotinate-nucleotide--dimethylbenzimidazole phosphoribosyltransferase [Treponema sp.]|nr:nicotinate-nucleotide--dimethylbenzimidazole phosphoribosyltransferase [Treponema sp.]